jgi:hypothetical protein
MRDEVDELKVDRANLHRHYGSLAELMAYLEREHAAYMATAKAYQRSSPERAGSEAIAAAARDVVEAMADALRLVKETLRETNGQSWSGA